MAAIKVEFQPFDAYSLEEPFTILMDGFAAFINFTNVASAGEWYLNGRDVALIMGSALGATRMEFPAVFDANGIPINYQQRLIFKGTGAARLQGAITIFRYDHKADGDGPELAQFRRMARL